MNEKHNSSVGWKWMHAIPVSEVKILQTSLSQERWGMMLSSKLRTSFLYKSRSPWCWFYLRVDYPLTDKNLYGRAQGLLVLMVSQSICLQTWWIFFRGWLHAPLCGKKKNNTLVMWAHLEVWINTPSAAPNIFLWLRPVSPDTSATSTSVASAIFEAQH